MALKGLVIDEPWIGLILAGEKTWEMRSQPCRHRGPLALIRKGSGVVVGLADLADDLDPLDREQLRATVARHRLPAEMLDEVVRRGWTRPWVLTNVVRLTRPVPYAHTSGGSWVNLTSAEEAGVRAAVGTRPLPQSVSAKAPIPSVTSGAATSGELRLAQQLAGTRIDGPVTRSSARQVGSKLYIDVEWDDGHKFAGRSTGRRPGMVRQAIAAVACLISAVWLLCSMVAIIVGIHSANYSAITAFFWVLPACALIGISGALMEP